MTTAQRQFWEAVRDFAQGYRRSRKVSLDVAADALALEQEIEARLSIEELPMALGFARRDPAATSAPSTQPGGQV